MRPRKEEGAMRQIGVDSSKEIVGERRIQGKTNSNSPVQRTKTRLVTTNKTSGKKNMDGPRERRENESITSISQNKDY